MSSKKGTPQGQQRDAPEAEPDISEPVGMITSMGAVDVLKSAFGGTLALAAVVFLEYGMVSGMLDTPKAVSDKFVDQWTVTILAVSFGVSFLVVVFGWGAWVRVIRFLVAKYGAERFDRTAGLRKAGVMVLLMMVGLGILALVHLLQKLGF